MDSPTASTSSSAAASSLRSLASPSHSQSASTSKGLSMPGRWKDSIAATLGYSTTATTSTPAAGAEQPGAAKGKRKERERGGIPLFPATTSGEVEEGEQEQREEGGGSVEEEDKTEQQKERERLLNELVGRIMYEAPLTPSSTHPILILAPCHLPPPPAPSSPSPSEQDEVQPPPKEIEFTQAELMDGLRRRLEEFVQALKREEEGYTVILLSTPTPYPPPTALLISTYLSLSREARKKVRRVWIVGKVGWWMRVLLALFLNTLLSRKTTRKIKQVTSLSDLARGLEEDAGGGAREFGRLDIPLEVYTANALLEPDIVLPPSQNAGSHVFGVALEELMGANGGKGLPRVVKDCLEVLREKGPESLGIFRRSPSAANVKILQGVYDRGQPLALHSLPDAPYVASSLLKCFLRSLPSPIFPPSFYPLARACPLPTNPACVEYLAETLLPQLRPAQLVLLAALCETLHLIAEGSEVNLMDGNNLAVVLTPNLIGGLGASEVELEMCRVPGMEVGTMRGVRRKEREVEGGNSLAGVLKGCLMRYHDTFPPHLLATLASRALLPRQLSSSPSQPISATAAASLSSSSLQPSASTAAPTASSSSSSPPTSRRSFSPSSSPTSSRRPSLASLYEEEPASSSALTSIVGTIAETEVEADGGVEAQRKQKQKSRRPSSSSSSTRSSTSSRASASSLSLLDRSSSLTSAGGGSSIKAHPRGGSKSRATVTLSKGGEGGQEKSKGREDVRTVFAGFEGGEGVGRESEASASAET